MSLFSSTKTKAEYESELEDERRAKLPVKEQCLLLWDDIKKALAGAKKDSAAGFAAGRRAATDSAASPLSAKSFVWTKRLLFIGVAVVVCLWSLTRLEPAIDEEEVHEDRRMSLLCQIPGTTCTENETPNPKAVVAPAQRDAIIFPTGE